MKLERYIPALIITIAATLIIANNNAHINKVDRMEAQIAAIQQGMSNMPDIQPLVEQVDNLAAQVAALQGEYRATLLENADLRMENEHWQNMIREFDIRQEGKYDFEGHQNRYMERVRK